ncbi:MAG: virulence RhuM family protein, partial [Desulfobacterales bacterium]|nr:virulence RhuM family protein [Desulfobacterales bacterium]
MSESQNKPEGEVLVYQTEDGVNRILVRFEGETVWLTQAMMAELYDTSVPNINIHIHNVLEEHELSAEATIKEYLIVRQEGQRQVRRPVKYYNLDMILAVGYRVRSPRGVMFRQWATEHLREYLIKGFTLDDERLKGGSGLVDYFDELLTRIREIRASEARVYQRIREIFALACDYREGKEETQRFFATMQNKMHHAATGMTAAEIVRRRADAGKSNMGLTAWKGGRVIKRDVGTAKNYLDTREIDTLNRITVMFLDQAEFRAQRRQDIRMSDWEAFLDKFLRDTELPVLIGPGTVSREDALSCAQEQYDAFAERRRLAAEADPESRYVEDLRTSAKMLETRRKKQPTKNKKPAKSRNQDEKKGP